jgi:hypothetical protein
LTINSEETQEQAKPFDEKIVDDIILEYNQDSIDIYDVIDKLNQISFEFHREQVLKAVELHKLTTPFMDDKRELICVEDLLTELNIKK